MMRIMKAQFYYYEEQTFQLVELDYSGDEVSMIVLVPGKGFKEGEMDGEKFNEWKKKMRVMDVKL